MGCCFSSERDDDYNDVEVRQPSLEERRRLQAEAAERRLQQQANRGIANPESVKRRQEKAAAAEKMEQSLGGNEGGLRWQVAS